MSNRDAIHFQLEYLDKKSKVECDLCEPKFISRNFFKRKKGEKNTARAKLIHNNMSIVTCDECYFEKSIGELIQKLERKSSGSI